METPHIQCLNDGRTMITAQFGPENLPKVRTAELSDTWTTASVSADAPFHLSDKDPEGIIFHGEDGRIMEFEFDDYDALCWATAIHRSFDLTTIKGLSLCFRMLALYQLMAENHWARGLFTFDRRNNLKINKALLSAAAVTPLSEDGSFNVETIRQETGAEHISGPKTHLRL